MAEAGPLDFLEAFDSQTRSRSTLDLLTSQLHEVATAAELASPGDQDLPIARWVGELVAGGYLEPTAQLGGSVAPPIGVPWSDRDLWVWAGFRLTASGRTEAERVRRHRSDLSEASATPLGGAMNPNDQIRDAILRYLYDVHSKARSPKTAGQGIRDLQAGLKPLGHKQQEVASNLDYLIQKGWVREMVTERTFTTPRGTTQSSEKRSYKISDAGIDKLESASTYERPETASHINITNIHGVTVVGEGNVVNTSFTEVATVLSDLRQALLTSDAISDEQKLDAAADIDALQSQLQKPAPKREIVAPLWKSIEAAATVGGFVELAEQAAQLLGPLIS